MKKLLILVIILLFGTQIGFSQQCQGLFYEVSLERRTFLAAQIVEAEVISKYYFLGPNGKNIYTNCTLKVYNQLKGNSTSTLEIVYLGGTLNGKIQMVSSSPNLNIGSSCTRNHSASVSSTRRKLS